MSNEQPVRLYWEGSKFENRVMRADEMSADPPGSPFPHSQAVRKAVRCYFLFPGSTRGVNLTWPEIPGLTPCDKSKYNKPWVLLPLRFISLAWDAGQKESRVQT